MSGTVLARRLGLDIYRGRSRAVVSKWLGETEKNLSEVFDAAEPGHVVLLFNEADSLFGKRTSDVKSSNDRYANMETNYLLQRLERFGGLAILTTNLTSAIDQAFKRRFTYDVFFSFPSPDMRAELWRRTIRAAPRRRPRSTSTRSPTSTSSRAASSRWRASAPPTSPAPTAPTSTTTCCNRRSSACTATRQGQRDGPPGMTAPGSPWYDRTIVAGHGCDAETAERLDGGSRSRRARTTTTGSARDLLLGVRRGPGMKFARAKRRGKGAAPAVVGALLSWAVLRSDGHRLLDGAAGAFEMLQGRRSGETASHVADERWQDARQAAPPA